MLLFYLECASKHRQQTLRLTMAVYPFQHTTEEKNLKKRYAKLQEKRKQLRRMLEKPSPSTASSSKQPQRDILSPKDAKKAAKKLLETGKLTIKSKPPLKRSGFKRVGELPGQAPPTKKANTATTSPEQPAKPKISASDVKALYSRFVKASNPEDLERIPKKAEALETVQETPLSPEKRFSTKECTIFVQCSHGVMEEALRVAFTRFGEIQALTAPDKINSFITFNNPSIAVTARKEMDKGMIRGSDVHVEAASQQNGYVELTPEAAKNPWAVMSAGRSLTGSPMKPEGQRARHKGAVSYELDF